MREYKEHEKLVDRGNAPKFYDKMRRLTECFKTGSYSCMTQRGDHVADGFFSLLTSGDGEPDSPIDTPFRDYEDGFPAEHFKYGGKELKRYMHQLLWWDETIPDD